MQVFRSWNRKWKPGRAVALGVFDGLHLGHVRIVQVLVREARRLGVPASVITFDDHPHGTLAPEKRPPQLSLHSQRLGHFRSLGVNEILVIRFTQKLADMPPEEFVRRVLVETLKIKRVVAGRDFVFGRGGQGTLPFLRKLGKQFGFGVTVVPPRRMGGAVISSTGIRQQVASGHVDEARRDLGWPYALHGRVVHGEGRGHTFGLPTANLQTVHEIVPAPGVYAVRARFGRKDWPALCHIGPKPTFHTRGAETIEVHLPGWRGRLYGRKLEVSFYRRIRGIKKFETLEGLKRAIERDWQAARSLWPHETLPEKIFFN